MNIPESNNHHKIHLHKIDNPHWSDKLRNNYLIYKSNMEMNTFSILAEFTALSFCIEMEN